MRTTIKIFITVALAGSCFAAESVENIMQELSANPAPASAPVKAPEVKAAAVVEAPVAVAAEVAAAAPAEPAPVALSSAPAAGKNLAMLSPLRDAAADKARQMADENALDDVAMSWNGMILRDYPLSPAALEQMRLANADRSVDVRAEFPDVDFPEGSSAIYRPALKRIYVLNTPANIKQMENVMAALTLAPNGNGNQVEIEARFVEFSEGALEELGFNWADKLDGNNQKITKNWSVKDGSDLFSGALREGSDVFTQPQTLGDGETRASGDWTASRFADQFSSSAGEITVSRDIGSDINAVIRAMDQNSGVDVLSVPRIVTRNGEKALIEVGQTHYYPADFGVGANEGAILHVQYQGFAEQLLGVQLSVKPKLLDGDLIEMDMEPKITELLGWRSYEIAPRDSSYTHYQYRVGMTYEHDPIVAKLPIYRKREITTKVTIKNGSTMSMGGLISEKTENFTDKVPVLGSIPLVGRLFRSEGERSVKRNLMIFVTAKKVEPSGRINITR